MTTAIEVAHDRVPALSQKQAEAAFRRINAGLEDVKAAILYAWQHEAWKPLGYSSWDEACDDRVGCRIAIPREDRDEFVLTLRSAGMSNRAIAAASGMSEATVRRASNDAPAPSSVKGRDGKQYNPKPATNRSPKWEQASGIYQEALANSPDTHRGLDDEIVDAEIVPYPGPTEWVLPVATEYQIRYRRAGGKRFGHWGPILTSRPQVDADVAKLRSYDYVADIEVRSRQVTKWVLS